MLVDKSRARAWRQRHGTNIVFATLTTTPEVDAMVQQGIERSVVVPYRYKRGWGTGHAKAIRLSFKECVPHVWVVPESNVEGTMLLGWPLSSGMGAMQI
jgi:hypothetical protein